MKIQDRHCLIKMALRLLSLDFNTDELSTALKKWTMDVELLSIMEKVIEFDKASSEIATNTSCFALFIVFQLLDHDWR